MQLTYSHPSLLDSVTTEELKSYYVKRALGLHEARIEKKPGVTPVCQASGLAPTGNMRLANFSWNFRCCLSGWCLEAESAVPEAEGCVALTNSSH
jgi:hypothetical protein